MLDNAPNCAVTPESLMLCVNGRVQVGPSSFSRVTNRDYVPPEYYAQGFMTDAAIEKVRLYMLS